MQVTKIDGQMSMNNNCQSVNNRRNPNFKGFVRLTPDCYVDAAKVSSISSIIESLKVEILGTTEPVIMHKSKGHDRIEDMILTVTKAVAKWARKDTDDILDLSNGKIEVIKNKMEI